jgi:hypothetical protein
MCNTVIQLLLLFPAPKAPAEVIKELEGTWDTTANGYVGKLIISVGKFNKIEGSFFGHSMRGNFDPKTKRIVFERMVRQKDELKVVQVFTGELLQNADSTPPRYSLKGTFKGIGGDWGEPSVEYRWNAIIAPPGPKP